MTIKIEPNAECGLLSCPFCGGLTDGVHAWASGKMVVCADKKCRGGIMPYSHNQSEQEATAAWNNRAALTEDGARQVKKKKAKEKKNDTSN